VKFRIVLKDPEGVSDGILSAALCSCDTTVDSADPNSLCARGQALATVCNAWVIGAAAVIIEIDTDAKTAIVVPRNM